MNTDIQKPIVLVVEDDHLLRRVLVEKLQEHDYQTLEAVSGVEALEKTKQHPNVILLDIILPSAIDGFTFLEQLKGDATTRHIPVIILSNLSQQQDIEKGKRLGAEKFLVKVHVTPDDVVESIRDALK